MRKIIRIGLPSALENTIYNIAMTLVIRFLNQMDTEGINVAARPIRHRSQIYPSVWEVRLPRRMPL